jgi:hypothetical protein
MAGELLIIDASDWEAGNYSIIFMDSAGDSIRGDFDINL